MATIVFGSNRFSSNNEFTVVGKDNNGSIVLGGFEQPPAIP
jgi:hypothetical protein